MNRDLFLKAFYGLTWFLLMLVSVNAFAAWMPGAGEHFFGPETSEAEACAIAEESAKTDALRSFYGETLSVDQQMSCREAPDMLPDSSYCQMNKILWNQVGGDIRGVSQISQQISKVAGSRVCRVQLVADVVVNRGKPDRDFDLGVRLNNTAFREGETLSLTLEPSQPMYVAIFSWLPYPNRDARVERIFPNAHESTGRIERKRVVPNQTYRFQVELPTTLPRNRRLLDEYLLIVASKQPVQWRDSYSFQEFNARLSEFSLDQIRYVKRGYQIILPTTHQ